MGVVLNLHSCKAVLFDVDGTLAETEAEGHLPAFNESFAQLNIPWNWSHSLYGQLLEITGGFERMRHHAKQEGLSEWLTVEGLDQLRQAHTLKNELYAKRLNAGLVQPRTGLVEFMRQLQALDIPWAVVTTTSRSNWGRFGRIVSGLSSHLSHFFSICGEDVTKKKPDPEAYIQALERLGLEAGAVLAIEDSPNGLQAATRAGIACAVIRSIYFRDASFEGATVVTDDYLELKSAVELGAGQ